MTAGPARGERLATGLPLGEANAEEARGMALAATILAESARLAAACTACGECVKACPMPDFVALPAAEPGAVAAGMRAVLRGEVASAGGLAWVAACTRSGQCSAACPEKLDVAFMLRLAGMR